MSSSKKGGMIVLSSPSGAGKTTLVKKISKNKNFSISISHTTRSPRPNERNGRDYYFISKNNFRKLIKKKEFLEHAKVLCFRSVCLKLGDCRSKQTHCF